jgi:hypothetical protein
MGESMAVTMQYSTSQDINGSDMDEMGVVVQASRHPAQKACTGREG